MSITFRMSRLHLSMDSEHGPDQPYIEVTVRTASSRKTIFVSGVDEAKECIEHYFEEHIIRSESCPICINRTKVK